MIKKVAKQIIHDYGKHGRIGPKWYQTMNLDEDLPVNGYRDNGDLLYPRMRKLFPESIKGLKVLDIGSNAGVYCIRMAQEGAHVIGIEHDYKYLGQGLFLRQYMEEKEGKLPITYYCENIEKISLKERFGWFDFIIGIAVIYHMWDISAMARQISDVTDLFIGRFSYRGDGQRTKMMPFTKEMKRLGFKITYNDGRFLSARFLVKFERNKNEI